MVTATFIKINDEKVKKMSYVVIEEIVDRINALCEQEQKPHNLCSDYLHEAPKSPKMIDEVCRTKISEWIFQFVDCVMLNRKTAFSAMSILDRFLSSRSSRSQEVIASQRKYQLAAITSLFISIKLFESFSIDTSFLARLSKQCYEKGEFTKMENDIVFSLNFNLNSPTALCFLECFTRFVPRRLHTSNVSSDLTAEIVKTYSKYLVERSVENYKLSTEKPSNVALAALSISMQKFSDFLPIDEDDVFKVIYSIEKCTHCKFDGSHINHVINLILLLPRKEKKCIFNELNDHDEVTPKLPSQQSKLDKSSIMTSMCQQPSQYLPDPPVSSQVSSSLEKRRQVNTFVTPTTSNKHPRLENKSAVPSVLDDFASISKEERCKDVHSNLSAFETPPTMTSPSFSKENEALTYTKKPLPAFPLQQIKFPILENGQENISKKRSGTTDSRERNTEKELKVGQKRI